MTKGQDSHFEMAHARKSEGIHVIFDQDTMPSPPPSRSRSKSSGGSSRSSGSDRRVRCTTRRRYRSSSTSSRSSRSRSHSRSRSRPRCHRRSSRCRCASHHRSGRVRRHCSPPRRHSQSYSCSPSPDGSSRHRRNRSRSKSGSLRTHRKGMSHLQYKISKSSSRTLRRRSRSRSSGRNAVCLSAEDKRELLRAAKANATRILGVEQLELPESVKPMLEEQLAETTPEPEARVRPDPVRQKTTSESSEVEPDEDMLSPRMSPKRKFITFSVNNSVAKPTAVAPSGGKVTARMDSYESRKPYGHWVPVKVHKASRPRKHTLATSH